MMNYLSSLLFIIGPLAVAALLFLFLTMGKRLGQALELPPYYRLYAIGVFLFLLPLPVIWILLLFNAWGLPHASDNANMMIRLAVFILPMAIAITVSVYATAKYWSWIWDELRRSREEGGEKDAA